MGLRQCQIPECSIVHDRAVFNNAATPKGVANYCLDFVARFEGNRIIRCRSFAHPLAMLPEPHKGVLNNSKTGLLRSPEVQKFRSPVITISESRNNNTSLFTFYCND